VAGDRFVRREVRQAVSAVEVGGPEVDPEFARNLAVDRAGAAIGAWRSRLLFGRHPLHFQMAGHHGVERPRQDRADLGKALLDIGHDLRPALVTLAELVTRILGQSLHSLANAALRVAYRFQDRVHAPLQLGELLEAHPVDLVG
jgi:hypothetical protein